MILDECVSVEGLICFLKPQQRRVKWNLKHFWNACIDQQTFVEQWQLSVFPTAYKRQKTEYTLPYCSYGRKSMSPAKCSSAEAVVQCAFVPFNLRRFEMIFGWDCGFHGPQIENKKHHENLKVYFLCIPFTIMQIKKHSSCINKNKED